jgi:hypothetical protein
MFCLLTPLFLPFILLRVLIKTAVALVMLPFALMMAFVGVAFVPFAVCFALLMPLMPIALLVGCVWLVVNLFTPRSPAASGVRG